MKNWKYIEGAKTGNTAHSDKVEVIKRLLHANWSVQEIYELLKKEGYEVDKNFIERMKTGNDTPLEYAHRKPKVINEDKTGAEEFFKKLSDDVKEREKKDDADIEKVGNSLIGKTVWVKKSDGHQYKATVLREDGGRVYVNTGDGDQFWRLKHEVEVINKVGNFKTGTSQLKPGDKVMSFGKKGTVKEVIGENTDNIYGEPLIKVEFEDGTTKTIGEHYMRKVGNTKTGNYSKEELLKYAKQYGDKELIDYIMSGKMTQAELGARTRWFQYQWDGRDINGKIADKEKVGNKVVWKEGPYRIEKVEKDEKFGFYNIPKGSFNAYRNSVLYGNFNTLDSAKAKMNEEIRLDKEYNRKYTTNSKTGNATPNYRYKDFLITNPEGHEYIVFLKDGRTVGYRGTTSKAQAEDWCDWHDPKTGKPIGNSKTENGLARARKAMNKGITMWKGNDSAYIKEDGTVSYLENNSFETDKDKFESQESAIKELSKQGYVKK